MSQRETLAISRFADGVAKSYPRFTQYRTHHDGLIVAASSSPDFRQSRRNLMEIFLTGKAKNEMPQALALEHIVSLALRIPLETAGFSMELSPQSLERSEPDHKGLDLLITGPDAHTASSKVVYAGIDVKLRQCKSPYKRGGFGWNERLLSPYMYLSLGNFTVDENISLREWIDTSVIPKIHTSGRIPYIDQFRTYLIGRIERSVSGYLERIREPQPFHFDVGLPKTEEQHEILTEKLAVMQSLMYELNHLR